MQTSKRVRIGSTIHNLGTGLSKITTRNYAWRFIELMRTGTGPNLRNGTHTYANLTRRRHIFPSSAALFQSSLVLQELETLGLYGASGELNAITDDGPRHNESLNDPGQVGSDVVFVYVAHLHHVVHSANDGDEWHPIGPKLKVLEPSCSGSRGCISSYNETQCTAIEGCKYSPHECRGPFASCLNFQNEFVCNSSPACKWELRWDCIGASHCMKHWNQSNDRQACDADPWCTAVDLPSCLNAGVICRWNKNQASCEAQSPCSWISQCTGIPAKQCSDYSVAACENQEGCRFVWK